MPLWVWFLIGKLFIYIHLARQSVVCSHNNLPLFLSSKWSIEQPCYISLLDIEHYTLLPLLRVVSSNQVILSLYSSSFTPKLLIMYYIKMYSLFFFVQWIVWDFKCNCNVWEIKTVILFTLYLTVFRDHSWFFIEKNTELILVTQNNI